MNKPVVFCDLHHSGLAYSLRLLIERRLGGTCLFPIGLDWFYEGFWHIAAPYGNSMDTVRQYLDLDHRYIPHDGTQVLNNIKEQTPTHYVVNDYAHGDTLHCVTFQQFKEMKVDIVIASIPLHWFVYNQLIKEHKSEAKLVCQMGNMFSEAQEMARNGTIKNLMASTIVFPVPASVRAVFYHQEVDQTVFAPTPPTLSNKITSFVNCLPDPKTYYAYKTALPELDFKSYGGSCPDGTKQTTQEIAQEMKESLFGYHVKPGGDGFGHILYDWAFIGRPIITRFSDYTDKLGGELLTDGITAIDIDKRSFPNTVDYIRQSISSEHVKQMAINMQERVKQCVDYQKEEKELRSFFDDVMMSSS